MRYIPKNSKVKINIYKSFTISDLIIAGVGLVFLAIIISTNMIGKWGLGLFILVVFLGLLLPIEEERVYERIYILLKYLSGNKRYGKPNKGVKDIEFLKMHEEIEEDVVVNKDGSYVSIIEVFPINLNLMDEHEKRIYIDSMLSPIIKAIPDGAQMILFKRETPLDLSEEVAEENNRLANLGLYVKENRLKDEEYRQREKLIKARQEILTAAQEMQIASHQYYLAYICPSREQAIEGASFAVDKFKSHKIKAYKLGKESILSLLYSYFSKEEEISFSTKGMVTQKATYTYYQIHEFPKEGGYGWLSSIFSIENTNAYLRIEPISKDVARKQVDKSIPELREKMGSSRISEEIDGIMHEDGLRQLMYEIQEGQDGIVEIEVIVECVDEEGSGNLRREVKRKISELGFVPRDLSLNLEKGYLACQLINTPCLRRGNLMPTSVIAMSYPFVGSRVHDKRGMLIGETETPAFIDVFRRDRERLNSNMVILGRSGSGKSYATKALITNLITEGVKIYILDPEGEYEKMVKTLGGEVLNAASTQTSMINPLEIIRGMADETGSTSEYFYSHLQFLEELYFLMFPNISQETLDRLNRLTSDFYLSRNIDENTDLTTLTSHDYPTFSELSEFISSKVKNSVDPGERARLTGVYNLLSKLRKGGAMHALWDGKTSLISSSNLVAYNFQSLLASKNQAVANVQMLLILRLLENEIMMNRELNLKQKSKNKICIIIDEAHVFIDEKHPVALDFMYSFAKRIRKYDGMLIVITQNILDFSGSQEILKKSSAIINASQYSLIFSLNPADIASLTELYSKCSALSEIEREGILRSPRGRALLIASPHEHSFIDILATRTASSTWED